MALERHADTSALEPLVVQVRGQDVSVWSDDVRQPAGDRSTPSTYLPATPATGDTNFHQRVLTGNVKRSLQPGEAFSLLIGILAERVAILRHAGTNRTQDCLPPACHELQSNGTRPACAVRLK